MSQPESSSTTIRIPVKKATLLRISVIVVAMVIVASALYLYFNRPHPNPIVVSQLERQEDQRFIVEAGVVNKGADGWVKVYAQLESSGRVEIKDTRLYLENGEGASLTFTFSLQSEQGSSGQIINATIWAQSD